MRDEVISMKNNQVRELVDLLSGRKYTGNKRALKIARKIGLFVSIRPVL